MKSHLFVAYVGKNNLYGNFVLENMYPPENEKEIRLLEDAVSKREGCQCIIINWKVMKL